VNTTLLRFPPSLPTPPRATMTASVPTPGEPEVKEKCNGQCDLGEEDAVQLLRDLEARKAEQKGKDREDELSDSDLTLTLWEEELRDLCRRLADLKLPSLLGCFRYVCIEDLAYNCDELFLTLPTTDHGVFVS